MCCQVHLGTVLPEIRKKSRFQTRNWVRKTLTPYQGLSLETLASREPPSCQLSPPSSGDGGLGLETCWLLWLGGRRLGGIMEGSPAPPSLSELFSFQLILPIGPKIGTWPNTNF